MGIIACNPWGHRNGSVTQGWLRVTPEEGAQTHLKAAGVRGQVATAIRATTPFGMACPVLLASPKSLRGDATYCCRRSLGRRGIPPGLGCTLQW